MSNSATKPSVGRILHYLKAKQDHSINVVDPTQPCTAQIVCVTSPSTCNVVVWDHLGDRHFRSHVPVLAADETHDGLKDALQWMPYQKAVAKGETEATRHA